MTIKSCALILLGAIALPLSAQAQGTDTRTSAAPIPDSARPQPGSPAPRKETGGTLSTTGKGGQTPAPSQSPGVGGPDDARANEDRTNSPAATAGAVDDRNALSPATALPGPSGAPAVGRR